MNEPPDKDTHARRNPSQKPLLIASALLAVVQACLTIEGMGIEGFVLWVLILFGFYLLLFNLLLWLWRKRKDRA